MAKDRTEADKKEKKHKLSDANGISKSKSDKKEKKDKKRSRESGVSAADDTLGRSVDVDGDVAVGDGSDEETAKKQLIVGASVPFANPMADEKTMKKVLKGVRKGKKRNIPPRFQLSLNIARSLIWFSFLTHSQLQRIKLSAAVLKR